MATSDGPAPETAHVVLKSGHKLEGRVVGEELVRGARLLKIETDTGTILVPAGELASRTAGPEPDANATFEVRGIQVTSIVGSVERQAPGASAWEPVTWKDAYGQEILNEPNAIVRPGDKIRTAEDGTLDFMAHKSVWVHVAKGSEVEIPARRARGSLSLLKGTALFDVSGRPRGETFRVATPSAVLGVKGTRFLVRAGGSEGAQESVAVATGQVLVNEQTSVGAAQEGRWTRGTAVSIHPLSAEAVSRYSAPSTHIPPIEMALIPGGSYMLGGHDRGGLADPSTFGTPLDSAYWATASNVPISVTVRLEPFLVGRHEVSAGTALRFKRIRGLSSATEVSPWGANFDLEMAPAYDLSWEDAHRLSGWLGLSLPTEAEWEATARGRSGRLFPWGEHLGNRGATLPHWRLVGLKTGGPRTVAPTKSSMTFSDLRSDATPEGVVGMVSGPPEWCLDYAVSFRSPQDWHLRRKYQRFGALPQDPPPNSRSRVVRGALLSTRLSLSSEPGMRPGVRCVRRLGSP